MKRLLVLAMFLPSCSVLPIKDFCIENAPGLGTTLLTGSDLPDSSLALALEGDLTESTIAMARILNSEGIVASIYLRGKSLEGNQEALQELQSLGHIVGNGGFTGKALTQTKDFTSEIRLTDALITPFITDNIYLLRPPFDSFDSDMINRLNVEGLSKYVGPIGYDQDGLIDLGCWANNTSVSDCQDIYLAQIESNQRGYYGFSTDQELTVTLIGTIIPELRNRGFQFVSPLDIPSILISARNNGATPGENKESCNDYD